MIKGFVKWSRSAGFVLLFLGACQSAFPQDAYMNVDTNGHGLFNNFIGIKLFAADFAATSVNQDLQFNYVSKNPVGYNFAFKHDMNVTGLDNFFNLGLGLEENYGKHLSITYFNTSIGTIQHTWNWNVGVGAGYFVNLNKAQNMRLNASLKIYFESITYSFGDYFDTTGLGFVVDQVNVGTSIKNVKYVNIAWTLSPGLEFLYRRSSIDYFAGVYYSYVFAYHEKINFYNASVPVSYAIYDRSGNYVSRNIINQGNYIIQIGIVKEFGF
jgi:hypothetical protein